ncbi:MAG: metallophosphoesterase, partial [Prevotella sp.]|nr:metallophosphoesterase [Prevotella sp.]
QHADAIVFAGDLQNVEPQELYEHRRLLSSLKAADGVYSVLGNHDYSVYSDAGELECAANERELQGIERQMGWTLLMNDRRVISRNGDSIVIAGLENHGKEPKNDDERKRFPQRGDTKKALSGIADNAFVVMVEHTPTAWRDLILPETKAHLTLSGHTHGGQVNLFGLRLTRFTYAEDAGLYWEGDRALYVTSGVGGLVPMRFGMPGEIVVITLRKK